eukprot:scaffold307100_cov32-Tisochrysis_lutea.AAC.1
MERLVWQQVSAAYGQTGSVGTHTCPTGLSSRRAEPIASGRVAAFEIHQGSSSPSGPPKVSVASSDRVAPVNESRQASSLLFPAEGAAGRKSEP